MKDTLGNRYHCWFLNGIILFKTITKLKIDATHILHTIKCMNHVVDYIFVLSFIVDVVVVIVGKSV